MRWRCLENFTLFHAPTIIVLRAAYTATYTANISLRGLKPAFAPLHTLRCHSAYAMNTRTPQAVGRITGKVRFSTLLALAALMTGSTLFAVLVWPALYNTNPQTPGAAGIVIARGFEVCRKDKSVAIQFGLPDVKWGPMIAFVDKQNRARATLGLDPDDAPVLAFFDKDGSTCRIRIAADKQAGQIQSSASFNSPQTIPATLLPVNVNLLAYPRLGASVTFSGAGGNAMYARTTPIGSSKLAPPTWVAPATPRVLTCLHGEVLDLILLIYDEGYAGFGFQQRDGTIIGNEP
jgi:hypothetical protein